MVCRIKATREYQLRNFCFDVVATIGTRTSLGDPRLASLLGCVDSESGASRSKKDILDETLLKLIRGSVSTPKLRDLLISWETQLREEVQNLIEKVPHRTRMPHNSGVYEGEGGFCGSWMNEQGDGVEHFRATLLGDGAIHVVRSLTTGDHVFDWMKQLNSLFRMLSGGIDVPRVYLELLSDKEFKDPSGVLTLTGRDRKICIDAECLSNFPQYTRMLLITIAFLTKELQRKESKLQKVSVDRNSENGSHTMTWKIGDRDNDFSETIPPVPHRDGEINANEWYRKLAESFPTLKQDSFKDKWDVWCLKADLLRHGWHRDGWLSDKAFKAREKFFGGTFRPFSKDVVENLARWTFQAEEKYLDQSSNNSEYRTQDQWLKLQFRLRTLGYVIIDVKSKSRGHPELQCVTRDKKGYSQVIVTAIDSGLMLWDRSTIAKVPSTLLRSQARTNPIQPKRTSGWKDILCADGRFARYVESLSRGHYSEKLLFVLQFICNNYPNFTSLSVQDTGYVPRQISLVFEGSPLRHEIIFPEPLSVITSNEERKGESERKDEWKEVVNSILGGHSWKDGFDREWAKRFDNQPELHSGVSHEEDTTCTDTID